MTWKVFSKDVHSRTISIRFVATFVTPVLLAALAAAALIQTAGCGGGSTAPEADVPDDPVVEDRPADPGVSFQVACPQIDAYDSSFIVGGGVGPDQIRSLDNPPFISADRVDFLRADDRVIGVEINGEARAYPKKILNAHEIVNQCFGDTQTMLSYCPLTNTALHYRTEWACGVTKEQRYAVSGILYLGNLVMGNMTDKTLWFQMYGDGFTTTRGLNGRCLEMLYAVDTSWGTWKKLHPKTLVLSENTGFPIDYNFTPYRDFWNDDSEPWFYNDAMRERMDTSLGYKERVLGVMGDTERKAFRLRATFRVANEIVGGIPVALFHDPGFGDVFALERVVNGQTLTFEWAGREGNGLPVYRDIETGSKWTLDGVAVKGDLKGERMALMPSYQSFWYAWSLFFPDSELVMNPGQDE
jgi:hypothetical protein